MVKRVRQMIAEVKEEVGWDEMMRETEDVRRDIDQTLKDADVSKELKDASRELNRNIQEARKDTFSKGNAQDKTQQSKS